MEPDEGTPQDHRKGVLGVSHYLSCPRCGYHRRLDRRTMLARQTSCPQCAFPSRLELSSERPQGSMRPAAREAR